MKRKSSGRSKKDAIDKAVKSASLRMLVLGMKNGAPVPQALDVVAKWVCGGTVCYECDFCWTRMKKDGSPAKNAVKAEHTHSHHRDVEHRTQHCFNTFPDWAFAGVNIHVTEATARPTIMPNIRDPGTRPWKNEFIVKRLLKIYPIQNEPVSADVAADGRKRKHE